MSLLLLACTTERLPAPKDTGAAADTALPDTGADTSGDSAVDTGAEIVSVGVDGAAISFEGENDEDRAGRHVSGAGDIDDDGRMDVYIGADAGRGVGEASGEERGRIYLFPAASLPAGGQLAMATAPYIFVGEGSGDYAGHSGGKAGDVDGDGIGDLLFSAYHTDDDGLEHGRIYIRSTAGLTTGTHDLGDSEWIFGGDRDYVRLGHGTGGAGDVDGDGLADVIMGACCGEPADVGWVSLALGGQLGPPRSAEGGEVRPRWDGEVAGDAAGVKATGAGDVDGDGLGDLLVSSRFFVAVVGQEGVVPGGKAYVIYGASVDPAHHGSLADADASILGASADGQLGYSLATAGDVDGDGRDEVLLGAYHVSDDAPLAGAAYLFREGELGGTDVSTTSAWITFGSAVENHQVGVSVSGASDVDGDGRDDVLIGADGVSPPENPEGTEDPEGMDSPGDAYLFSGARLAGGALDMTDGDVHFFGDEENLHLGISVSLPGDVDGDGKGDVLLGSERGQELTGRAWLFTGW